MSLFRGASFLLSLVALLLSSSTASPFQSSSETVRSVQHGPPGNSWHPGGNEPTFYKGHDLSSVQLLNEYGYIYKDMARGNETRPVEDILGDGGMNGVRLR